MIKINLINKSNLLILLTFVILLSLFFAGTVEGALTTNLLSYWSYDSNANDNYGSIHGSASGATYTTTDCQLGGGCYSFGGDGDYISMSSSSLAITGSMSVSLWIKPTDTIDYQGLFFRGDLANSLSYVFAITDQGANDNYGYYNTNSNWKVFTDFIVDYGSWQHVVWTYDGTNMIVYKNNVASASQAATAPVSNLSHTNYVSATWAPPNTFWVQGTVDEVAVWNKALTAAEVSSLYNSGSGMNPLCGAGQYLSSDSCTNVGDGYYSPTNDPSRYACPSNSDTAGATTSDALSDCVGNAGYYNCQSGTCSVAGAGYYSPDNDNSRYACAAGYYCSTTTNSASTGNGQCTAGYYGSSTGQTAATCNGQCTAGYYCTAGSTSATQNVCGTGKYCPTGSSSATACPAGTYGSTTTLTTSACTGQCSAGYYGSSTSQTAATCNGACTVGYYCTAGSTSATQNTCTNKPLNSNYNSTSGTNSCGFACAGNLESKYGCATAGNNTNIHFLNNVSSYSNLTVKVGAKIYLNNSNLTISQLILDGSGDKIIINSGSFLIINRSN
ncbi:LamG domain-containing protein [Candidatus Woesearchaeota archaeon]|nr:LamG domain-containing protein [Candidatus Woesearchaeota archaeon]